MLHFGTLVFALYYNFGISIGETRNKIQTCFKETRSCDEKTSG